MKIKHAQTLTTAKKTSLAAAATLVIISGGWLTYSYSNDKWPFSPEAELGGAISNGSNSADEEHVSNHSLTSSEQVVDGQAAKKEYAEKNSSFDDEPVRSQVGVGIAFADIIDGNLEVRAFTNGIINSGKCKLVAKHTASGASVTETVSAFIDASTTQCEPILISTTRLAAGEWNIVVEFMSETHNGTSETRKVNVS